MINSLFIKIFRQQNGIIEISSQCVFETWFAIKYIILLNKNRADNKFKKTMSNKGRAATANFEPGKVQYSTPKFFDRLFRSAY